MEEIDRESLRAKIEHDRNLALVEVLGPEEYEDFHLPGAMNVPLRPDFETSIRQAIPDESTEVVVYCRDEDCGASSEAGRRMEALGYEHVRHFAGGKMAWREAGLPVR